MAKRKQKKEKKQKKSKIKSQGFDRPKYPVLTSRLKRWIVSLVMFASALIVSFSFFGKAKSGGAVIFHFFYFLIGKAVFFIPLLLVLGGILFLKPQKKRVLLPILGAIIIMTLGIDGFFQVFNVNVKGGGIIGYILCWPILKFFGSLVALIVFSVLILISVLVFWEFTPKRRKTAEPEAVPLLKKEKKEGKIKEGVRMKTPNFAIEKIETAKQKKEKEERGKNSSETRQEKYTMPSELKGEYKLPPIDLLSKLSERPSSGDREYSSAIIKKTLANFGISVEMGEVNIGPTVTQYTLKPAEGIKLSKITALNNDLSMALAAHPIRIEAPIPGRSLVGIEVPNKVRASVSLRDLIARPEFQESSSLLSFPLGRDVSGNPVFADLERMPHLLVAGSTGSGKTIFLQDIIVSLIYRNSPRILRLILIDPKRVEFSIYNSLPHLLTPVVFRAQKTVNTLNWAIGEMERRFDVLRDVKVRDIGSFNALISKNPKLREDYGVMPYIVLVIDELADLMAAKGREVEAGIVRLSQLARAVGLHLIVATQRPSVDVITGLIKANLSSRVAFQVVSQVDSRTILDSAGAETLLGRGDMLYLSSEYGKPKRIQGCYVLQKDVKKVISFIINQNKAFEKNGEEIGEKLSEGLNNISETAPQVDFEDPLYEEAKNVVVEYKRASASLLQRRLKIGYARAARLLDILESKGVVGPADGAKPREVYVKEEEAGLPPDFGNRPDQPPTDGD